MFLLLSLFKGVAISQSSKCIYEEDYMDEFTGSKIVSTEWKRCITNEDWFLGMAFKYRKVINKDLTSYIKLQFSVSSSSGKSLLMLRDSKMLWKTETDSVLTFEILEAVSTEFSTSSGITSATVSPEFLISEDTLEYLLLNKIVKIRVYTEEGYLEGIVGDKQAKRIIESSKCILNEN